MKSVALVSGGKDSCYNILHCIKNGHEVVALANLHPPLPPSIDSDENDVIHEMDSFMYQTVGHSVLSLYSDCFGIPMYRAPITGTSVTTKLDYATTAADETEDLYTLLQTVKTAHPDIEAVSVGAILSTYQRTRVENVCSRLGLTSLAYLWRRNQASLFDEMIQAGINAIVIKVAGAGLTAEQHLGKSLGQLRHHLFKLNHMYGSHICGEGGEYETLVLDCPFFGKKVVVDETQIVKDDNGDVAYLKLRAHAEYKNAIAKDWMDKIAVPPLLSESFLGIFDSLKGTDIGENDPAAVSPPSIVPELSIGISPTTISVANVTAANSSTISDEIALIFKQLSNIMASFGITDPYSITSITFQLSDMSTFPTANESYKKFFTHPITKPNPPSRACISTLLASSCRASLSCTITRVPEARSGLHVQGRSYWAPANIGPYAQACTVQECVYLAGQIPLIPATMTLYKTEGVLGQAVLAMQNLERVMDAVVERPSEGDGGKFYYLIAYTSSSAAAQAAIHVMNQRGHECGVFAAVLVGLPVGAWVEYGGVGINTRYLSSCADGDADEDDEFRVSHSKHFGIDRVEYGTVYYESWCCDDIISQIASHVETKAGDLLSVSIYISCGVSTSGDVCKRLKEIVGENVCMEIVHVKYVVDKRCMVRSYGVVVRGYLD
ncbi:hypothetical protein POJ06DRAFT_248730 [Lipomyces tetrasporus]|uniref:Diphthine--ammonia ligase n=1 Tax=Lipomyces tetrasporus TaxID=54092 RepID=A0AAD7QV80_9ASCO|nr:uncharacterized protein POJ06DRAFT_248730 [Lipomyces tetrasporus]KAJ8102087.1 hypothetical protein POJ06DRAFT_248730 [Lipomyces tetrasporus]